MNKKIRTPAVETLFEAIIQLKSVDECFDFFEDLAGQLQTEGKSGDA